LMPDEFHIFFVVIIGHCSHLIPSSLLCIISTMLSRTQIHLQILREDITT